MDQQQDQSQGNQWGQMQQQQGQAGHDQSSSQPQSMKTPTQGSRAFKIVNPHTNEEVKGKEGFDQSGMQNLPPSGQMQGQAQQASQQAAAAAPAPSAPAPQQQPPQQQPTPQPPSVQPGPSAAGASPVMPGTGPKKKIILKNTKIEKAGSLAPRSEAASPVPPSTGPNADNSAASAAPASATTASADQAPKTGSASNSAAPSPEAPNRRPPDMASRIAAFEARSGRDQPFASSIKALNLEPMKTHPGQVRPKASSMRPSLDLPTIPAHPSSQQQGSQQQSSQPQQPAQQKEQTQPPQQQHSAAPSPVMPQHQPQQTQMPMMQMQQMQQMQMQQMPMAHMGMHPMHQGQMMMQGAMPTMQMQQMQPVAASAPPTKSKGIKLKNAALARTGPKKDDHHDDSASKEPPQSEEPSKADSSDQARSSPMMPSSIPEAKQDRLSLKPESMVFERLLMLRIWRSHRHELHTAVQGLHTNSRPPEKGSGVTASAGTPKPPRGGQRSARDDPSDRSSIFGTNMQPSKGGKKGPSEPALKMSDKGYRVKKPIGREDELERKVRGLLNKICPDNLKVIVDRLATIELHKADELDFVIRIIFGKALAEPHYCETYADMVHALRSRYPEFPPEREGEKPQSFTRVLLNTCQEEFESLPQTFEATEDEKARFAADDLAIEMKKRKDKILANMKFIGNLFLRNLLAVKVIGQVVHDLVGIKEKNPEEHMIECVCELLQAIGHTLDGTPNGKVLMHQFAARLMDLKQFTTYSRRIQFRIQDLLDLRANHWQKKLFKEQAKTKEEVRKDAINEARKNKGGTEVMFSYQTVGVRPAYIEASKAPGQGQRQRRGEEVVWDQAYVRKICQYYADDKNGEELVREWNRAHPSSAQAKQGIEWLLDIGFNDRNKEEVMADTITELLVRRVVSWEHVKEAIAPFLEGMEEMIIDVPGCDRFFHSLLSRLILKFGRDFNCSLLQPLNIPPEGSEFTWKLLVGSIRKCRETGGKEGFQRGLDHNDLVQAACKARKCSEHEFRARLREEGL